MGFCGAEQRQARHKPPLQPWSHGGSPSVRRVGRAQQVVGSGDLAPKDGVDGNAGPCSRMSFVEEGGSAGAAGGNTRRGGSRRAPSALI